MKRTLSGRITVAVTVAGLVSSFASGQTTRPETPREASRPETAPTDAILSGPRVEPAAVEDRSAFGRQRPATRVSVPARRWFEIAQRLDLTPDQRQQVRKAVRGFQRQRRVFTEQVASDAELRELRRQARLSRRTGEPMSKEARETLAAYEREAPRVIDCQHEIWAILTAEQQEQMKKELARVRRDIGRRGVSSAP